MQAKAEEIRGRIKDFLTKAKQMGDSATIFSPPELKAVVIQEIKKVFSDRESAFIDSTINDREQIDRVYSSSLKEGSLLIVTIDNNSLPVVTRRLEQIFEDGHMPINIGSSWRKVEPVHPWQALIWIDRNQIREDEFILRNVINHSLVVTE